MKETINIDVTKYDVKFIKEDNYIDVRVYQGKTYYGITLSTTEVKNLIELLNKAI